MVPLCTVVHTGTQIGDCVRGTVPKQVEYLLSGAIYFDDYQMYLWTDWCTN